MIPDHLSCRMLVEEVTEWMEGGLPAGRRAELELHLVTCVGCTAYVEQLRQTSRALAATAQTEDGRPEAVPPEAVPPEDGGPPAEVRTALLDLFRQRRPPGAVS